MSLRNRRKLSYLASSTALDSGDSMERVVSTLRVHKLAEHDPEEKQSQKPTQEYEPGTFQDAEAMMKRVREQMAGKNLRALLTAKVVRTG